MRNFLYQAVILCLGLFILACGGNRTHTSKTEGVNHLIQNTVAIGYEYAFYVPEDYWFFKGIPQSDFIAKIYEKSRAGAIPMYYPRTNQVYPTDQVQIYFSDENNSFAIPQSQISHLVFYEEWFLDTLAFVMKKRVLDYSLVRTEEKPTQNGESELVKSLIATYKFPEQTQKKPSELTPIAQGVTYEVPLTNPIIEDWLHAISIPHVVHVILDKILSGTVPVYSFMVRDSLIELSTEEVRERLGEETYTMVYHTQETGEEEIISHTTAIDYSEIVGFVFIEDWYIDETTMKLYKFVQGIAPVREYAKIFDQDDYELVRTIPCVVFFSH